MDFDLTPTQRAVATTLSAFAARTLDPGADARDRDGVFDRGLWEACAEAGVQGLPVPAAYGGAGADRATCLVAMEALGCGCSDNGLLFSLGAHLWACTVPLVRFGSDAQRARWLPGMVRGSLVAAHAATEPGAGSDVFALRTTATRRGDGYVLDGHKCLCTNAPVADVFVVLARTPEADDGALSAFLVPRDTPGLRVGPAETKLGLRTSPLGDVIFDGCDLGLDARLGAEGAGAAIFHVAMDWERTCLFAAHLGAMERLLARCVEHAAARAQFGRPLAEVEPVYARVAEMKVAIEAGRLLLHKAAWALERSRAGAVDAAIAKLYVGEAYRRAALDTLHVFGGAGYLEGSSVAREVRDALAATIYSGTSDMQRRFIAGMLGT